MRENKKEKQLNDLNMIVSNSFSEYLMQTANIPVSVCDEIENLVDTRTSYLISWDDICLLKNMGSELLFTIHP